MLNTTKAGKALAMLAKSLRRTFGFWELPDLNGLTSANDTDRNKEQGYQPPIEAEKVEPVLSHYGVHASFADYRIGSAVTTFEFDLPVGTKFSNIQRSKNDLARDLGVPSLRLIESLEDTGRMGIEVPNKERFTVSFKEMVETLPEMELPLPLGEDTLGNPVYADLSDLPHLLVAGQTGSGKSVFLNTSISSLIATRMPEEVQFLMIDPKQVEFIPYEGLPHLMEPIANDTAEAKALLDVAVNEMERRFLLLKKAKCKKISDYREKKGTEKLPYIVFIVDEFADLMMMGSLAEKKEVESKIIRIAQKARAVGIHMILATQKPLAKIVTSLIKANMPARIAFEVASGVDSRVVLDELGAENLLGKGDMLFKDSKGMKRIQAPWISDDDIEFLIKGG